MRAFVAIDMPDDVREALETVQAELPVGRLMAPETFHLTLAFLDDQPPAVLEAVHDGLAALEAAPFELQLRGVDVFGGARPRVLWAGAGATPPLAALRERVRRAVLAAGVDLPRERFRPHVTLARFGHRLDRGEAARLAGFLADLGAASLPGFRVEAFQLYRSSLGPGGAVHEVLAEYPLTR